MTDLPRGWVKSCVDDLFNYERGVTYSKADASKHPEQDRLPVLRANNFNQEFDLEDLVYLPTEKITANQLLRRGDLLFAMSSGSMSHVGKCITIKKDMQAGFGAFCGVLRPVDEHFTGLFAHIFQGRIFRNYIEEQAAGTNINNLKRNALLEFPLLLPPLNEQRRIVEKIEAMFERIDKGVENLRAARSTLALYRQSLLKSAFEGRLTADWRAKNPSALEDPKALLARIQKERDTRYKAALADWQTALTHWRDAGETGKKPAKPKRLPEIQLENGEVDARNWGKFPLDVLISEMNQGWSPKCNGNDSIGPEDWTIVKTTAVQHRKYGDTALKRLPKNLKPRPEIEIQAGDFLMTRKGPRVRTGVVCLVRKTRSRIMLCDTVYRFRCDDYLIYPPLLEYALNSPDTLREIDFLKAGISESGISLNHGKVRSVRVSFPFDRAEQTEITRILDARLDAADKMEAEIDAALARAEALRQSILKRAFAGDLVPQDPTDEPASTLLARIKAERAAALRNKTAKAKSTKPAKRKTKA